MISEELTGILQSRGQEEGQSYVVIDGVSLNVPDYVLDWMAKMKIPLQNGETVLYKKQQDREGGAWRLTKIRRPSKVGGKSTPGPSNPSLVDQKSGILISHYATGCTVRMENGDRTYALQSRLPEIELPQRMDFTVDKQGFVRNYTFRGKASPEGFTPAAQILKDNLDRLNGPADGETVEPPGGELVKAPATPPVAATVAPQGKPIVDPVENITDSLGKVSPSDDTTAPQKDTEKPDTARPTPSPLPAPENARLSIVHTVNLGNYESLKVGIEGQAEDREELELFIDDTIARFGRNHPATMDAIDTYRRRVLGVQT